MLLLFQVKLASSSLACMTSMRVREAIPIGHLFWPFFVWSDKKGRPGTKRTLSQRNSSDVAYDVSKFAMSFTMSLPCFLRCQQVFFPEKIEMPCRTPCL